MNNTRIGLSRIAVPGMAAVLCALQLSANDPAGSGVWQLRTPEKAPESRIATAFAYMSASRQMILFGGSYDRKGYDDTWSWDGLTWSELQPVHRPPAINSHAMAYDAKRNEVVLFGGFSGGKLSRSTWVFDGRDWREAQPTKSPRSAINGTMAFNPISGRVMLYGGMQDTHSHWEWDGSEWLEIPADKVPPARSYAGLAFDEARKEMVLFGGITNPYTKQPRIYNDTWAWNGKTWRQVVTPIRPSARYGHNMAYHPGLKKILLVGGKKGQRDIGEGPVGLANETWTWDGSAWKMIGAKGSIEPAYSYGMAYDAQTQEFVVALGDSLLCAARGPKVFVLQGGR
ncbi:MAG: Kelch repeat-containing protein [Spirochaetota bacterium]